ncbi:MAG TPA: hypothetical protein VNW26_06085 [Steroidobacteraceae bacterium]|nr:hypothetical protein [Steroidobacteraceae bacterium]
MKYRNAALILPLLAAIAAGCTTMGTGYGSSPSGSSPVTFDGTTYSGQYFQITRDTTVDSVAPLWVGWHSGWRGAGYWDGAPTPDFITHYTGRVVANLATATATHMRCHFQLVHPSEGMAGGGSGECQLPDGKSIDATFPAA